MYLADQADVWEDVASRFSALGARSPSLAMHAIYDQKGADLAEYTRELRPENGQTGVVAATGGRVVCCDLFDRPETLEALWDRLIASYAVEAILEASQREATTEEGKAFLWETSQAAVTSHAAVGRGSDLRLTSEQIVGAALEVEGTILHLAAFRREDDRPSRNPFESPRNRRQSRRGPNIG
jgi:hypothetical protein